MPDKPIWSGHLQEAARQLRSLPDPWIDRATLQTALRIGRRRAQQLLAPCASRHVGSNSLAHRETLLAHLQRVAGGDNAYYERQRRKKLAESLELLQRIRLEQPQLLVEAPLSVVSLDFVGLPAGISITPGEIRVQFETPAQALEKLLALAMAIGNDQQRFESLARTDRG